MVVHLKNVDGFWQAGRLKLSQIPSVPKSDPSTLFLSQVGDIVSQDSEVTGCI